MGALKMMGTSTMWTALHDGWLWLKSIPGSTWAAWVQAIGTVAAVIWAARIARAQGERERRHRASDRAETLALPLQMARDVLREMRVTQAESMRELRPGEGGALRITPRLNAIQDHCGRVDLSLVPNVALVALAAQIGPIIKQVSGVLQNEGAMISQHSDPDTGRVISRRGPIPKVEEAIREIESICRDMEAIC